MPAIYHTYRPMQYSGNLQSLGVRAVYEDVAILGIIMGDGVAGVVMDDLKLGIAQSKTQSHAGYAFQMAAAMLKKEFNREGPVLQLLLRYT
jgi:hypothetical protein